MRKVIRLATIALLFGSTLGFGSANIANAQEPTGSMPAYAISCDVFVEMANSAKGEGIPDGCQALEGIRIIAFDRMGNRLDACRTDESGVCTLDISPNGTRIFFEDTKNVPEGYAPVQTAQRIFTYTEFAEVHFVNYRSDVLPAPPTETGTINIESRICPDRYAGDDFATDCGELVSGIDEFAFANDAFNKTGSDGNTRVRDVAAGAVTVIGGQSEATGDVAFACAATDDPSDVRETSVTLTAELDNVTRDFAGTVQLADGENLTCTWYQIPNLDRGLWTSLNNPMASGDRAGTWIDETGNLQLYVVKCADGVVPEALEDAATDCMDKPEPFGVSAIAEDGTVLASGGLDAEGKVLLNLNGQTIADFTVSSDARPDVSADVIGCFANADDGLGDVTDPMQQSVTKGDAGWSVPGFGDDVRGVTCIWYLIG